MQRIFHKVSNLIFITHVLYDHFIDRETEVRGSATLLLRPLPELDFTSVLALASSVLEAKPFFPSPGVLVIGCSSLSLTSESSSHWMLPHDSPIIVHYGWLLQTWDYLAVKWECCVVLTVCPSTEDPFCTCRFYLLISAVWWGVYWVTETNIFLICFEQSCAFLCHSPRFQRGRKTVPKALVTS